MSMRHRVILRGVIVGQGRSVNCDIHALKVTLAPSIPPEYTEFDVVESVETHRLPDGNYEIQVNGQKIPVRRTDGTFLAAL